MVTAVALLVGMNVGGGVKITLAGPLRVRVDYRLFTLRGSPRVSPVHRFYAGVADDEVEKVEAEIGL